MPIHRCLALVLLLPHLTPAFTFSANNPGSTPSTSLKKRSIAPLTSRTAAKTAEPKTKEDTETTVDVLARQTAVLDGAEWASLQVNAKKKPGDKQVSPSFGCVSIVVGEKEGTKDKVVGFQIVDSSLSVMEDLDSATLHANSVAILPTSVSNAEAMSTLLHSIPIHAVLPPPEDDDIGIGGSDEKFPAKDSISNIAVIGSSAKAVALASAMNSLGHTVTLVTTNDRPKGVDKSIQVLPPVVGEQEVGFCSALGKLDGILDTLGNEIESGVESSTIRLLRTRHSCNRYFSIESSTLALLGKNGLLWGPGKANEHTRNRQSQALKASKASWWTPPKGLGNLAQSLMERKSRAAFPALGSDKVHVPGWTMGDFWESTTWPRDAGSGIYTSRYGFPVKDDIVSEDMFDGMMIAVPPSKTTATAKPTTTGKEGTKPVKDESPYITTVTGVNGLYEEIIDENLNAVLFLSAPFCRTCRYLKPQYERMARKHFDSDDTDEYTFCKADASGLVGKALGRELDVDSVPTLVLYQRGERFGRPLSISRLPSPQLDLAISWLRSGQAWNEGTIRELEKKPKK